MKRDVDSQSGPPVGNAADPVWGMTVNAEELDSLRAAESGGDEVARTPFESLDSAGTLSDSDRDCMDEVREVLARHGKLDRFGISLLHDHFPLSPDEILLETSDADRRTMTLRPAIVDPADTSTIDTQWYLGRSMPLSLVKCRTSMHQ